MTTEELKELIDRKEFGQPASLELIPVKKIGVLFKFESQDGDEYGLLILTKGLPDFCVQLEAAVNGLVEKPK